jgi:hypothetical protein
MAHIENETGDLRTNLMAMEEPELLAQQIVQKGAEHALTTLLGHGCTEQAVQDMLAGLRSNMLVIEAVAREKGYARLFADDAEGVPEFDLSQPCAMSPGGQPLATMCPRCKNPHHKCDNGIPRVDGMPK